jgi:phospholipid/cholesterol/gamma-HCH transport system substrate-binding protein
VKPFRSRNPIPIALIGVGIILLAMFGAFNAQHLPIIGGGDTVMADFANAANLQTSDDVRVAGIKVGKVTKIELHGDVVRVTMKIKGGPHLGRDAGADIKIKTLLGQKYISLDPGTGGTLSQAIPLSRTTTPIDVTEGFIGLSNHIAQIDTKQLAKAFDTLSATFQNSPKYVRDSLDGLSRLSKIVADRDQRLRELLSRAQSVTGVLASRDQKFVQVVNDGDLVLQTVQQQETVIHDLLLNTTQLSQQLSGLVRDNTSTLKPALDNLHGVTTILKRNQANLQDSLHLLAPFIRDFDNTLGNGRWFDTFVANLNGNDQFTVSGEG